MRAKNPKSLFSSIRNSAPDAGLPEAPRPAVLIVGNPNVGKSALFNRLTGRYVTVSNYPGTTVEVARGHSALLGGKIEVIDTPGMYSLMPITEEERVARDLLFREKAQAVIHVIDAKNIERMLGLTLQLTEAGLPVILALNMYDEARKLGIRIDCARLEQMIGAPVVPTVSITGEGIPHIVERIRAFSRRGAGAEAAARPGRTDTQAPVTRISYGPIMEEAIARIVRRQSPGDEVNPWTHASLLLQGDDAERERLLKDSGDKEAAEILRTVSHAVAALDHSPHYYVTLAVKRAVDRILSEAVTFPASRARGIKETLDRVCLNPWTGFPVLLLVVYFGLYRFVGKFGAGTLVDFLDRRLFVQHINPWVDHALAALIPWRALRDLIAGDYGIITLGLRYAVAIVLPIVGTFFFVFALLEDTGYLPRLAMLIDRVFKRIGLNGRAVIPIVLGFGCDSMATMVTRTLETKRERIICTVLLALAIPCSAQLGLILGLLSGHPYGLAVWSGVILGVFLLTGSLAARLLPGEPPTFYMELPPLRIPTVTNVAVKTYTRMVWYFKEILPLFIVASILIWAGQITSIFQLLVRALQPVVQAIGLPAQASVAFLFGFFRRDYGAAGLYDLQRAGALNGNQLTVAAITLTLFLPCVAQFLIMAKERGMKMTLWVSVGIMGVAFAAGFAINLVLTVLRVHL